MGTGRSAWDLSRDSVSQTPPGVGASRKRADDPDQQVLGADETAEHKKIEDQIVKLQEEALELHRARQNDMVSDDEYEAKVMVYSQRMADLQARQKQLKADATRRAEAFHWLDSFQQHMASGEAYNTDEARVMHEIVDQIIVYDDRLEIRLRCGVNLIHDYL